MAKAGTRGADVLVLDLEDGVHPDEKVSARDHIRHALDRYDWGASEVFVRANGLDTVWGRKDVDMIADIGPKGAILPKAADPAEVEEVARRLAPRIPLFLMIETAPGVLTAPSLARVDNVAGLLFGAADFREDIHASPLADEAEILVARAQVVLAARAAGVEAFDTPWFDYGDRAGLEASSRRARRLGFDGKTAIHPNQVGVINDQFSPSAEEVARARRIVEVVERAMTEGRSVATMDGEMVEALHLKGAKRVLRQAGLI